MSWRVVSHRLLTDAEIDKALAAAGHHHSREYRGLYRAERDALRATGRPTRPCSSRGSVRCFAVPERPGEYEVPVFFLYVVDKGRRQVTVLVVDHGEVGRKRALGPVDAAWELAERRRVGASGDSAEA